MIIRSTVSIRSIYRTGFFFLPVSADPRLRRGRVESSTGRRTRSTIRTRRTRAADATLSNPERARLSSRHCCRTKDDVGATSWTRCTTYECVIFCVRSLHVESFRSKRDRQTSLLPWNIRHLIGKQVNRDHTYV